MRCVAVCLSLMPLAVVEIVCRTMEPGTVEALDRDPLVDLSQVSPLFVQNEVGDRWEIPESRYNFFRPDSFAAAKRAGTRRIFVLGGSTVQGRPYATETAFSTWLRLRMEANQPDTEFEVVNCGGVSYASYRVAKITNEVLKHEPDAIVIYTGHNEFLEDREYADIRDIGAMRRGAATVASKFATARWVRRNLLDDSGPTRSTMAGEVDARLDHAGGLERYRRDDVWRAGVERHFEITLREIVKTIRAAEIPLVLCVPVSDLVETPPFKVDVAPGLPEPMKAVLKKRWGEAMDLQQTIDFRINAATRCLEIDPGHAGAHYFLGRWLNEKGDPAAKQHLVSARDFDVCPLRATSRIMEIVVQVATEYETRLVSTDQLFDQLDGEFNRRPDGIPDPKWFVDHVHPSVRGHQLIAETIVNTLDDLDWVAATDEQANDRYQILVDAHLASLGEAYYARGQQRLQGLRNWAAGRAGQTSANEASQTAEP